MNIHWIDLAIIIAYLLGITLIGVVSSRKQTETSTGYFLAGRSLGWVTVGLALFATNISTVHLIGDNPDATLITLIQQLLPTGLRGLVVAGLLAALMSTVAGALNSTSTLVSIDIVKRMRPETKDQTLVRIGQITAVVVMLCAIACKSSS